jgi:hypothetical protein
VKAVLDAGRPRAPEPEDPAPKVTAPDRKDAVPPAPTSRPLRGNVEAVSPEAKLPRRDAEPPLRPLMMPLASVARPSVDARAPLRESTVAQRSTAQRGETPAVVHVTIDRVDVRTPGTATPSRLSPKPRASSTVSLSEYLHQRDRSRNGGHQ